MTEQEHRFGGFQLNTVKGWSVSSVVMTGPPDLKAAAGMPAMNTATAFQRNVVATVEEVPEGETAEAFVARQTLGLKQAQVFLRETLAPEPVDLGGTKGVLSERVISGPSGEQVQQMQVVCIAQGRAYAVMASHLSGPSFEAVRDEFRNILTSFRIA